MFASAFGAFEWNQAIKRYYDLFEKAEEPQLDDFEEYEPETEDDIEDMLRAARRAGAIE